MDGKYTKHTFFVHMPAFLKRANTQIRQLELEHDEAVVRGNLLATALRGVIHQQYKTTLTDEEPVTIDAAVNARLARLGILDIMPPLAKRLEAVDDEGDAEEEGGDAEEEEEDGEEEDEDGEEEEEGGE